MENPMQKMFSGHKYSKDDIESNFINIDADISLSPKQGLKSIPMEVHALKVTLQT